MMAHFGMGRDTSIPGRDDARAHAVVAEIQGGAAIPLATGISTDLEAVLDRLLDQLRGNALDAENGDPFASTRSGEVSFSPPGPTTRSEGLVAAGFLTVACG